MPKEFPTLLFPPGPWPLLDPEDSDVGPLLGKSMGRFFPGSGSMEERNQALYDWVAQRSAQGVWPYGLITLTPPGPVAQVRHASGAEVEGINLTAVDYLGLTNHPALREAAIQAIHEFGVHTPSSGPLMGNSQASCELEGKLARLLGKEYVFLCPTGWAAAFAALSGVVRKDDYVVMDELAHQCLQQAAYGTTPHVHLFRHLDNGHLEERLREIRAEDPSAGVLVVTEGLFSMDGDAPDFKELVTIAKRYDALTLVDVAHDLGAMGPQGSGTIGAQGMLDEVDIIAGSFSKALGTNGGFVANRSAALQWAQLCFGGPYTYSTAMSPIQVAVANRAMDLVTGQEGDELRGKLMANVEFVREGAQRRGLQLFGAPSPIVPVFIGKETHSRVAGMLSFQAGLVATCLEFPVVQRGAARYRLSLSPNFSREELTKALDIVEGSIQEAARMLAAQVAVSSTQAAAR